MTRLTSDIPSTLSKPARDLFAKLRDEYRIVSVDGLMLLGLALSAWDRTQVLEQQLKTEGINTRTSAGNMKANPAAAALRDARSEFHRCLRALNLDNTPKAKVGRPPYVISDHGSPIRKIGHP